MTHTRSTSPLLRACLALALGAPLLSGCATRDGGANRDGGNAAAEAEAASATTGADAAPDVANETAALNAAIAGAWRDPKNSVRDRYRHPRETLEFFRVLPGQTVVEITPGGGGWYAEILAPYLRDAGVYHAAMVDPSALEGRGREYQQKALDELKARLAKTPAQLDRTRIVAFDPKRPVFGPAGSADTVLTFRNVHNWVSGDAADAYFSGFFAVLKPGGTLGVVDHRARPGTGLDAMKKSGCLTEQSVIDMATRAGFVLDARSEVNANPRDNADHPNGVWTLPPGNRHDAEDAPMYQAIGESDRMTLRFVKPTGPGRR